MKTAQLLGVLSLIIALSACKDSGPEEVDAIEESYTISGRLYQDLGEVPVTNQEVFLEGYAEGAFPTSLGSDVTDGDGYFSITYVQKYADDAVVFSGLTYVALETDPLAGTNFMQIPWNVDLDREFSLTNLSRLFVEVNFQSEQPDTLFFYADLMRYNEFTTWVKLPEIDPERSVDAMAIPVNSNQVTIESIIELGRGWDNQPSFDRIYAYGFSREEFKSEMIAIYIDTIPEGNSNGTFTVRGFPYTDSLRLDL